MKPIVRLIPFLSLPLLAAGCIHIAPIEVKPIHIVHDVNIRLDKQLDEFFAFEQTAATQPASQAVTTTQAASKPVTAPAPTPTTTTASQ